MDCRSMLRAAALMLVCLWSASPAWADTFVPPHVKSYLSGDGRYRLTVTPSPDPLAGDKKRASAAPPAQGRMERRQGAGWVQVWRRPLRNPVAPSYALISIDGRTATFNDWYGAGQGDNVVVLYNQTGRLVRAHSLRGLLPPDYIRALPHSVSSIQWGHDHAFSADGRRLLLRMAIPREGDGWEPAGYVELALDTATGQRLPGDEAAWKRAYAEAEPAVAAQRAKRELWKAVQRAPLHAPTVDDTRKWRNYLSEAYRRLDPDGRESRPARFVLQASGERFDPFWSKRLGDMLIDAGKRDGRTLMLACFSQDRLIAELVVAAQRVPARSLVGRRVYVVVEDKRSAAVAAALSHTGATYLQLDPTRPVQQRREVLQELLRD